MKAGRPRQGEQSVLATIGITKKLSMQAQALAGLPRDIQEDVAQRRLPLTTAVRLYHLAKRIVLEGEADAQ
jgi:hypothetical protein